MGPVFARGVRSVIDEMKRRVLGMFEQMKKEALDLHELFEAGGNDVQARQEVFGTQSNREAVLSSTHLPGLPRGRVHRRRRGILPARGKALPKDSRSTALKQIRPPGLIGAAQGFSWPRISPGLCSALCTLIYSLPLLKLANCSSVSFDPAGTVHVPSGP